MYTNFNRHDNFSKIELRFLSNIVSAFTQAAGFSGLTNKLYGLYDGYYYHDIMEDCNNFLKENNDELKEDGILVEMYRRREDLALIIEKVKALPEITQEQAISRL